METKAKSCMVAFRCSEDLHERLVLEADFRCWSVAALVRRLCEEHVSDLEKQREVLEG